MTEQQKELMQKAFWEADIADHPAKAWEQGFEAACEVLMKELPRWKVRNKKYDGNIFDPSWMIVVPYHENTYEIWLQDLLDKLPKEE